MIFAHIFFQLIMNHMLINNKPIESLKDSKSKSVCKETANANKQFKETKTWIYNLYLIRQNFKGSVVYRALLSLNEGSLEITFTVPLTTTFQSIHGENVPELNNDVSVQIQKTLISVDVSDNSSRKPSNLGKYNYNLTILLTSADLYADEFKIIDLK